MDDWSRLAVQILATIGDAGSTGAYQLSLATNDGIAMNVPLRPDHEDWLKAQVASGRFQSLEEALASAVAGLRAQDIADDTWAKPLVEEALAALDRGEGTPWRKGQALEKIKAGQPPKP